MKELQLLYLVILHLFNIESLIIDPSKMKLNRGITENYHIQIEKPVSSEIELNNEQVILRNNDGKMFTLLNDVDPAIYSSSINQERDIKSGLLLSCHLQVFKSQHDISLGRLGKFDVNLLVHSRMKRWWMTPSFHTSVDTIPVETQSLLIEIGKSSSANNIFKIPSNDLAMIESEDSFSPKLYAVILPLIDFKQGFRATLYGNEGGYPAVNKHLGIRLESGDNNIVSNHIQNAIYIGVGTNPYDLLSESYDTVARTMGTFQTRKIKKIPPGLDSFGYCTWDAFYSKVNSENVVSGVQSLSSIGYPPRFVIIDDGWQSTTSKVDIREQNPQTSGNTETMNNKQQQQPESSSTVETLHEAAEYLTGTPISGDLATQQLKSTSDSPFIKFAAGIISKFYTNYVENGKPDSCPVRLWSFLSQTVLKATLIEFFAKNTDFSKRLSSWKANSKFENPAEGRTLRGLVENLKQNNGVNYVFVWHALAGYWGGVSEDSDDDMPKLLNSYNRTSLSLFRILDELFSFKFDPQSDYVKTASDTILNLYEKSKQVISEQQNQLLMKYGDQKPAVTRTYSKPTPHMLQIEPSLAWDPSSLIGVGGVALDKLEEMYSRMYTYLVEAGIDGVKVDAQSGIGAFGAGNGGGSNIARASVSAMERNVRLFFGNPSFNAWIKNSTEFTRNLYNSSSDVLGFFEEFTSNINKTRTWSEWFDQTFQPIWSKSHSLYYTSKLNDPKSKSIADDSKSINLMLDKSLIAKNKIPLQPISLVGCMCHSTENLYNFYETSLARVSDDFYPKDDASQTVHIASCAYNSVMIGEIAIADWDMFHSKHVAAEMHAASRSISGGPIYVSDAPGNHNSTILKKLILPNGRVLRSLLPARPTVDCLFKDTMRDRKSALKLWNVNKANAVVGVFNVQGSSWDKNFRKYIRHDFFYNQQIEARVRPLDVNGPFLDDMVHSKTSKTQTKTSNKERSFIAWSSMKRQLHFLSTKYSAIVTSLLPRQFEIFTFHHLRRVSWPKSVVGAPGPTLAFHELLESHTDGDDGQPIDAQVYWTPLGLIDMYNGGAALEELGPSNKPDAARAEFSVRGSGRVGVFASRAPAQIFVDGERLAAAEVTVETTQFGGYLVTFGLPVWGDPRRLPVQSVEEVADKVQKGSRMSNVQRKSASASILSMLSFRKIHFHKSEVNKGVEMNAGELTVNQYDLCDSPRKIVISW